MSVAGQAVHESFPLTEVALEEPVRETVAGATGRLDGIVIGTLARFEADGTPSVFFPGQPTGKPFAARSTASLTAGDVGHQVALVFEGGDRQRPIVLGVIQHLANSAKSQAAWQVEADGERIELRAEKEIVFRCGEASITLTRAGKILLRGKYLLSRSSGVNRIKGGSVQIN